jgi:glycosyltransferase involved in cell wall biosynthesis
MRYFVGDVLPRLRAQVPDLELTIVGSDPTPEVLALQGNGVTVTGFVDDLSAWFSRARVFVAPLRYGAGIKGKLLISMAHGVPAVASPVAAEGIPAVENRDIFVARSTPEWCERTLELLRDDHTWTAMSRAGRSLIEQHYSRAANAVHVDRLLQALLARRAPHLEWA